MEQDQPDRPEGPPMGDVFADVPLFREIQRVLLSSSGPVNWELARQIGIASATWGQDEPQVTEADQRGFENAVRGAELHVAEFTGLPQPGDVPAVEAFRRAQWVEANVRGLREIIEPTAARAADALSRFQGPEEPAPEGPPVTQAVLGQIALLLLGAQVGVVLGYLGQRALGQFDIAVPRPAPAAIYFVVPNIAQFEREWSLPPMEFRAWVALHEVVHRFEFARPWVREHFVELVRDFASSVEIDVEDLRRRLEEMDVSSPEALQGLLESGEGLFGAVLDDEQRLKLARVQAFMAAAEGYGEHVTHVLGEKLLRSHAQIEEAVRRRREDEGSDPVFERLLGIEMKREQYQVGKEFCDTAVQLTNEATLARMWDSPQALPSQPEISEPRLWLARTA